jgi:hypothetical protein
MPYEISFSKKLAIQNTRQYVNECCWGGDAVRDELLPPIAEKYQKIQTDQEDWGWFIWFRQGPVYLAIDIVCDDPEIGEFRIHLTSRKRKFLWFETIADTPELERVREMVTTRIQSWAGNYRIERIEV